MESRSMAQDVAEEIIMDLQSLSDRELLLISSEQ